MLDSRLWAGPFRDTVEGRPGLFSVEFENGRPVLRADLPICKGAKPKLELVPTLLRSEIPLTRQLREIVADWSDAEANSAFCFKQFKRRKPGRYPAWSEPNIGIGLFVEERVERKEKFEAVVTEARSRFKVGRTTVTEAYSKVRAARKIQAKIFVKSIDAK
jgi:hypothetical protein